MIIKNNRKIENFHIIEYYLNDNKVKPLIFFFHGFTGNKNNLMGRGEKLAELGYHVVAIDAYLHGNRNEEWFDNLEIDQKYKYILDIVIKTAEDAKYLWNEYFKKESLIYNKHFYSYGVSMGAAITFYLSTITTELKYAVTLVGSPSFVEYYEARGMKYNWDENFVNEKNDKYKKLDPLINYKRAENTNFLLCLGEHDDVVNPKYSIKFSKVSKNNTILKMYNTGHASTEEMLKDSYDYLKLNYYKGEKNEKNVI